MESGSVGGQFATGESTTTGPLMSDGAPTVSVGIPVYNGEQFVAEAIESVLAQTDVDLELIISDNASTDRTSEICRKYAAADDRIRYVRQPHNLGAAPNFNELVRLASGRYFSWVAHDDICRPAFLSACVSALEADPGIVLSYPMVVDIDEDGCEIKQFPSIRYADQGGVVARAWSALNTFTPCFETFGVVRCEDLLQTQMIGAYASSDRTLLFELSMRGRFHEVPERLFVHRQHDGRSVFHAGGTRGRDAWFDPRRAAVHTSPRWRLMAEHVRAVRTAPISRRDRMLIGAMLSRAIIRYARPLASEAAQWLAYRLHSWSDRSRKDGLVQHSSASTEVRES